MKRLVAREWLDALPEHDSRAVASRRDLRRLNAWMRNASILARGLRATWRRPGGCRLLDMGGGEGHLLLRLARALSPGWRGTRATLLDRQNLLRPEAATDFRSLGWEVTPVRAEALSWLERETQPGWDVTVANLFLHHFREPDLRRLLAAAARRSRALVAVEPRRFALGLCFSRLVGLAGCNEVTRHDAPVSVRAGFSGRELSTLWRAAAGPGDGWALRETFAAPFSHLFLAEKLP